MSRVSPQAVAEERTAPVLDRDAFAALYAQHREPLYRFCLARTRSPEVAEDIVQEVFAKAFAVRSTFDPARPFWPWLASIAARECVDVFRRHAYSSARLAELSRTTRVDLADTTSTTVLRRIEQDRLAKDLLRLAPRQRIALQLFALDGWSYAEIAEQFGHSIDSVKALIVRARTKLRGVTPRPVVIGGACVRALQARLRKALSRGQAAVYASSDVFGTWVQGLSSSGAAIVAFATALTFLAPMHASAEPQEPSVARVVADRPATPPVPLLPGAPSGPSSPRSSEAAVERTPVPPTVLERTQRSANEAVAPLLPAPLAEDNPESVHVADMTSSPGYEDDHTLFVAGGGYSGFEASMLVSRDGGATWHRAAAVGLAPVVRLLPAPAYPRDRRLFAVTDIGLQVSRNDGETFETLAPLPGIVDAAASPAFDTGDPSILLVAGERLWRYRDNKVTVEPVELVGRPLLDRVTNVAYAVDYPADPTIYVSAVRFTDVGGDPTGQYFGRCTTRHAVGLPTLDCSNVRVTQGTEQFPLRLSSLLRSNMLFVPLPKAPLVSFDQGRSFQPLRTPWRSSGHLYSVRDLAAIPSSSGESVVVAQLSWLDTPDAFVPGPQLVRTDDGGRTWRSTTVSLPRFRGATKVHVTPTGRIVAAGVDGGLACSADDGRTWHRTCPTPESRPS